MVIKNKFCLLFLLVLVFKLSADNEENFQQQLEKQDVFSGWTGNIENFEKIEALDSNDSGWRDFKVLLRKNKKLIVGTGLTASVFAGLAGLYFAGRNNEAKVAKKNTKDSVVGDSKLGNKKDKKKKSLDTQATVVEDGGPDIPVSTDEQLQDLEEVSTWPKALWWGAWFSNDKACRRYRFDIRRASEHIKKLKLELEKEKDPLNRIAITRKLREKEDKQIDSKQALLDLEFKYKEQAIRPSLRARLKKWWNRPKESSSVPCDVATDSQD